MDTPRRALVLVAVAVAVAAALALTACGGSGTPSAPQSTPSSGGTTIVMRDLAFEPSSLTVKAGDTVTFKNEDQAPHEIVVGTEDLGRQDSGESKTWTAAKDGVYPLRCTIHPTMTGQITVGAGGSGGGSTGATSPGGGSSGGTSAVPGY